MILGNSQPTCAGIVVCAKHGLRVGHGVCQAWFGSNMGNRSKSTDDVFGKAKQI